VRFVIGTVAIVALAVSPLPAAPKDAADAAVVKTVKKKLKDIKVSVDFQEQSLKEVVEELKKQSELSFQIDTTGGVSTNQTITFKADDKPLDVVLDQMFKKNDLGYVIGRKKDGRYQGWLIIKKGKYRGDDDEDQPAEKPVDKPKPKPRPKPKPEDKPADSAEQAELAAGVKLKFAKQLIDDGLTDKAKTRLQEIKDKYPRTKAAKEAKALLEKLER
jgi:hypothetical protein